MLLTRHYDQRPFDETVCDAIIASGGVKQPSKKVQNICDDECIKHGSDFSCVQGKDRLKNIIAHLGTEAFPRIRIGVGEKTEGWDLADYGLARFSGEDEATMRKAIKNAVGAVETWISYDIGKAMNLYNVNPNPKPKKESVPKELQVTKDL